MIHAPINVNQVVPYEVQPSQVSKILFRITYQLCTFILQAFIKLYEDHDYAENNSFLKRIVILRLVVMKKILSIKLF